MISGSQTGPFQTSTPPSVKPVTHREVGLPGPEAAGFGSASWPNVGEMDLHTI